MLGQPERIDRALFSTALGKALIQFIVLLILQTLFLYVLQYVYFQPEIYNLSFGKKTQYDCHKNIINITLHSSL